MFDQVKQLYKCHLSDIQAIPDSGIYKTNNYHESRAVYISEAGLYNLIAFAHS